MKMAGFSLLEMLIAMAISAVLMVSAGRFMPRLLAENLRLQQQVQLRQELQQMLSTLEKAIRRAAYCHGECGTGGLMTAEGCVLIRFDENSNGQWEGVTHSESDYYGYRLRQHQLEMQRGVDNCNGSGWERLSDPAFLSIETFDVRREGRLVTVVLQGRSGNRTETLESRVEGMNL
ncbi:prepilin peptidase-dependent protein [Pantoea stewartii]|uniref:prepilin peptidase-dependent protein n=1 Tax=Pantoea stewartii TaxID=66269 RepID=UPI0019819FED|nr:prepilin peptidase-dependent protein [Pantoea stewartii]